MEKPVWRRRSSSYVVDTPFMRLQQRRGRASRRHRDPRLLRARVERIRRDLRPDDEGRVLLGSSTGTAATRSAWSFRPANRAGEEPLACALRELREETGYEAGSIEPIGSWYAEPVRSSARAYAFLARDAVRVGDQILDATEHIEVLDVDLEELRSMLGDGRVHSISSIAVAYRALAVLAARESPERP